MADAPKTPTPGDGRRHPASLPTPERRDAVVAKLSDAFAAGRIELEDFEERTEKAMRAQTMDDLHSALDGLTRPQLPVVAPNSGEFVIDQPRRHTSRLTFVMMGGSDRKGKWAPARRHLGIAWMGGSFLDFREAVLQPGVTHIHLFTMWGGIEVAVPPGLDVEVGGVAIMGGLERVSQESGSTDPRRPRLAIHAFALMGGIEVRTLEIGEKWDENDKDEKDED